MTRELPAGYPRVNHYQKLYDQFFQTSRIRENMALRRGRNGWARKPRRSLGSGFGAWSAATYCVRWLEDTVPRLCAKFGALRRTFNEVSSRSSMNWRMGNHVSEKRFCIFKSIKRRLRGVSRTVNWDDPIISMSMWRHKRIYSVQNKGTHQDISEIFWFIKPKRLPVVVYHFN